MRRLLLTAACLAVALPALPASAASTAAAPPVAERNTASTAVPADPAAPADAAVPATAAGLADAAGPAKATGPATAAGSAAAAGLARPPVAPTLTDLPLGSIAAPAAGATVRTERAGPAAPRGAARVLRLSRPGSARYSAVGVTWRADPRVGEVRIVVRHRFGGGAWSAWSPFGAGDAEPDPGRGEARDGSDPIWTGPSDGVEIAVTALSGAAPADVRLTLVDPGRSPADAVSTPAVAAGSVAARGPTGPGSAADGAAAGGSGGGGAAAGGSGGGGAAAGGSGGGGAAAGGSGGGGAAAGGSGGGGAAATAAARATVPGRSAAVRPGVYTRAQWGADPRLMGWDPEYSATIKAGFVHHTVDSNSYSRADVPAILRSIYAYHARTRDWGDIGYNFLVDRFGRIWEGRYGGIESTVIGAHTGGFNTNTFGVSMLGEYSATPVPAAVVASVSRLMAWKLAAHYLDPFGTTQLTSYGGGTSRYPRGVTVTKNVISGHRDVGATSCPGARGYAILPAVRVRAAAIMGTGLVSPTVSPAVAAWRGTGTRITGRFWRFASFTVTVTADCPAATVRRFIGNSTRMDVRWNLRDAAGRWVRPGSYTVTVTATRGGRYAVPYSQRVIVVPPDTAPPPPGDAAAPAGPASPAGFVPVAPARVLDTRTWTGNATALPLTPGNRLDVPVLGTGGVPASGVAAVALTVAAVCSAQPNQVRLWPSGSPPTALPALATARSTSNSPTVVPVGAGGRVSVAVAAPVTDVVLEVVGYLPVVGGAAYHPAIPRRVAHVVLNPGEVRRLDLSGTLPAGATGVAATLIAGTPAGSGVLRLWPAGGPEPTGPSLGYVRGPNQSALVLPALGAGRTLALRNDGRTAVHALLDLVGWFDSGPGGGAIRTVPRTRVADAVVDAGTTRAFRVTGVGGVTAAEGVLLQVVGLPSRDTHLAVFPSGGVPGTHSVDLAAGGWGSNLVVSRIAADGTVRVANRAGSTRVVLEVIGYVG